jgi:hypothetical protein
MLSSLSDVKVLRGMKWTNSRKILAALLGLGLTLGVLLSPLGFETRSSEIRTLWFAAFFIIVGMALPAAGLVSLLKRPKLAGVLAVIDAAILFPTAQADQAKFFFTLSPPPAVTIGEFSLILVGIGYMLYGPRVYAENRISRAPEKNRMSSQSQNDRPTVAPKTSATKTSDSKACTHFIVH